MDGVRFGYGDAKAREGEKDTFWSYGCLDFLCLRLGIDVRVRLEWKKIKPI
jgi:hypothetical protein